MAETVTPARESMKKLERLDAPLMSPGHSMKEDEVADLVARSQSQRQVPLPQSYLSASGAYKTPSRTPSNE